MRVSAGTASGVHPVQLGFGRVYVHLPDGFSYSDWMKGLNAGRSFVTTGPMLEATFNGEDPGHTFAHRSSQPFMLDIKAQVSISFSKYIILQLPPFFFPPPPIATEFEPLALAPCPKATEP